MNNNLVSVIIPVYNSESTIVKTLESVLKQTLRSIEIICVNDGSTDASLSLLNQIANNDARVKVISIDNSGPGVARNIGLLHASGDYIAFLDSDDEYCSSFSLEKMWSVAQETNSNLCMGRVFFETNGQVTEIEEIKNNIDSFQTIEFSSFQFDFYFIAFLYKREMLLNNGILFPPIRLYEDPVFLCNVFQVQPHITCVDVEFYMYHWQKKALQSNKNKCMELLNSMDTCLQFAQNNGYMRMIELYAQRINRIYFDFLSINIFDTDVYSRLLSLYDKFFRPLMLEFHVIKYFHQFHDLESITQCKYADVYEKIGYSGANIILYAAGGAGESWLRLNGLLQKYHILGVVDKNKVDSIIMGMKIMGIDFILQNNFDFIIIALRSDIVFAAVYSELVNLGVPEKKIKRWQY